jgi:predicted Zn-dependent protease
MSQRAAALLAAVLFAGCALSPLTGRVQLIAMSERQEERLGTRLLEQMKQSPGLVEDTPLSGYVQEVGANVAGVAAPRSWSYRFHVLDSPEPNAFALPGGTVLVTRGLLTQCTREDEIAGVLGHEVGHILGRHAAARAAVALPADFLAHAIAATVRVFDASESERVRTELPRLLLAPYSRAQEREADRVGVVLAASLGYEPAALARVLERLADGGGGGAGTLGLATHPPTPERVAIIEILSRALERGPGTPVAESPTDTVQLLDGLLLGPSLKTARVRGTTLVVPRDGLRLEYPLGWIHQVTPRGHVAVAPGGGAVVSLRRVASNETPGDLRPLEPLASRGGHTVERGWFAVDAGISRIYRLVHEGTRYELSAYLPVDDPDTTSTVDRIAVSARPATAEELATIELLRMRIVEAHAGELPSQLATRTDSVWSGAEIAAANGLAPEDALAGGQRIKIARREPLIGQP